MSILSPTRATTEHEYSLPQADKHLHEARTSQAIEVYQHIIEQQQLQNRQPILGLGSIADQKGNYEKRIV
jgi:hypothetical protein